MISDKQSVQDVVRVCYEMGIRHVIISPGSRNAPLSISFSGYGKFRIYSIIDERSAAFFALGIGQQTGTAAAIVCTSGSAVLNYAPAIAEAYYQHVPLLVLTADRPSHRIDVGDGQTIRQKDVYHNYIRWSTSLEPKDQCSSIPDIIKAINHTQYPTPGPVHINIPLDEPLYNRVSPPSQVAPLQIPILNPSNNLPEEALQASLSSLPPYPKVMLLIGMMPPDIRWTEALYLFMTRCPNAVVLSETTSNVAHPDIITQIDRTLAGIPDDTSGDYVPDLLITMGHSIISKRIKQWFRQHSILAHWHISGKNHFPDTFHQLSLKIPVSPLHFLEHFPDIIGDGNYFDLWNTLVLDTSDRHEHYIKEAPFTDLKAYDYILEKLPSNTFLQMGNSTVVRYVQLFQNRPDLRYFSNRGVSGIEGCTSTAIGAANMTNDLVVLLIGDISFGYDANAFWHQYLPSNLKIIAFNNGGGNIFRFIQGPDQTDVLESLFVTQRAQTIHRIALRYNLPYQNVDSLASLEALLPRFLHEDTAVPAILEVVTDGVLNARILRAYFKALNP